MKNIDAQLAFYQSYHRTWGCKATHFIGVPLVTFSILIPMGWFDIPIWGRHFSFSLFFVLGTLAYYFLLDKILAAAMLLVMVPMVVGSLWIARLPVRQSFLIFLLTFILGWIFQMIGHWIEGKRPALFDNFVQAVFAAPLFLMAELMEVLGMRKAREIR